MEKVVEYTSNAEDDIAFFKKSGQLKILKRLRKLIESIIESPYTGIGKPEQLRHNLAGCWSRRINIEHRLVYEIKAEKIFILSLRGHY